MLKFHVQEYERAMRYIVPACSLIAGRHVDQTMAIMDVKGVGLRHLTGEVKGILSAITSIDQANYPETLGKTLIINAPAMFRAIWAIVKPMLDARTQAKIEVCPADYFKTLSKWVDPESIPVYLGGKSQGSLIHDVGPWHDPSLVAEIDAIRAKAEGRESPAAAGLAPSPFGSAISAAAVALPSSTLGLAKPAAVVTSSAGPATDSEAGETFHDALGRRLSTTSVTSSACECAVFGGAIKVY